MAVKDTFKERQFVIIGVFIVAAVVLIGRAVQLQLLSSTYRARADAITIEKNILYPSRGVIYDRKNKLLVYNNAMYDIMATYRLIDPRMDTFKFCRLLGIDTAVFKQNLTKDWRSGKFNKSLPFAFLTMVTPEQYAHFQEALTEFPGFEAQIRSVRGYPQHHGGPVLGYLSEATEKLLKDSVNVYDSGDYLGKTGIERYYEGLLRGQKGFEYILKDNRGRRVGPWKEGKLDSQAVQGHDLASTLDLSLQALAEQLLKNKIGSVVAIEPKTGEILAMVTSPNFDPEQMAISKKRGEFIAAMNKDSLKPLFDRSVSAEYPPGSIFKPMMAAIALQMGVWDKNQHVNCQGGYELNGKILTKCHNHAYVNNLAEAIEHSCNAYFASLYRTMVDRYGARTPRQGLDSLNEYLYRFGMGRPLGIDFPIEKDGLVPTSKLYDKVNRREGFWYSTYIISNGIGQGENQLTTMQMANLSATLANRGWYITPHLVRGFYDETAPNHAKPINQRYTTVHQTGVEASHFDYIVDGMRRVILSGTGSRAQVDNIEVCGKTGTVENRHGDDSSVFIGFAPKNDPKIAIAVYIENGGWGNDYAAPITGLMIESFINGKVSDNRKHLIEQIQNARLSYTSGRGYYVTRSN